MATDSDEFDMMDDQSLLHYLERVVVKRDEQLAIREVEGGWVAEAMSEGLTRATAFRGTGVDRRAAMVDLARRLPRS